jgi:hypothetical protein
VSVSDLLGGRSHGVQFTKAAGQVGAGSPLEVRGVGSFNLSSNPLIYVDGVRINNNSKSGPMPKGLCLGSAKECMLGTGDCCTDQHALFIALCRSRGIPCRLLYGSRLKPENAGKDHDPGYRCWPTFFAPGLGWVPLDISSADTAPVGRVGEWFGGLDENRMEWAEGRDFDLEPRSAVRPDLVIRGWVEVDGKAHKTFDRVVNFTRQVHTTSADASTKTAAK